MPLEGMLSTGRSLTQTQIPFHQCPFVAMKLPVGPTHFLEKDVGLCWTTQHLLTSILIRILMKLLVGPSEDQRSHGRRVVTLSKKNVSWSQTQIHNNYPLIPSSLWFIAPRSSPDFQIHSTKMWTTKCEQHWDKWDLIFHTLTRQNVDDMFKSKSEYAIDDKPRNQMWFWIVLLKL